MKEKSNGHIIVSRYHPASAGQPKRCAQEIKEKLLKLTTRDIHTKVCRLLLHLRTTPCTGTGISPAEKLMSKNLKILIERLHPDSLQNKTVDRKTEFMSTGIMREFEINDPIHYLNYNCTTEKWTPSYISLKKGLIDKMKLAAGVKEYRDILTRSDPNHNKL